MLPTTSQIGRFIAIGKAAGKFVKGKLNLLQACKERELRAPGSCAAPDPDAVAELESKLAAGLAKQCSLAPPAFHNMGFPGPCADSNPLDGFTTADLIDCIVTSHNAVLDDLLTVEYDPTIVGPLSPSQAQCQSALAEAGARLLVTVMKSVQKCRNAILKGKITAVPPAACATLEPKTATKIAKVRAKILDLVADTCDDPTAATLKACTPDQTTGPSAATCIVDTHTDATDETPTPVPRADAPRTLDARDRPGLRRRRRRAGRPRPCDGGGRHRAAPATASASVHLSRLRDPMTCRQRHRRPARRGVRRRRRRCLPRAVRRRRRLLRLPLPGQTPPARVVEHANADLDLGWTGNGLTIST